MTAKANSQDRHIRNTREPDWRWGLALLPPGIETERRLRRSEDNILLEARDYTRRLRAKPDQHQRIKTEYPRIAAAEMANSDPGLTAKLKLLVLGNCDVFEISERLGLPSDVVEVWEHLFFDVRPNREAFSWIRNHVIAPERNAGNEILAAKLQLALIRGPEAARAILDNESDLPMAAAERLFQRRLELQARFDAALDHALDTPESQLRFLKMIADLFHKEGRLQLETERLAEKCREATRKHELAKNRLELQLEREQRRTAEQQQKAEQRRSNRPSSLTDADLAVEIPSLVESSPPVAKIFPGVIDDAA